ncbi:hypothetical protein C8J57DRAFT_1518394 [Mycena rebaudengoi]|nr:hypothetical protein C8J57DRAFT_1518394 [Mycena rebaudengoi]
MTQNDSSAEYSDTEICALIAGLDLENEPAHPARPECTQFPPALVLAPPTYISEPLAGPRDSDLADFLVGLTADSLPSNPSPSTPQRRTAIYTYHSPTQHGVTADWHVSLAGSASQGIPHGSVRTAQKAKKSHHAKGAYVVFHGRRPAVYLTWDEAKVSVSGSPNAIYRGYSTLERAQAAFKYAKDRGWTRSSDSQSPASTISDLPTPMLALETPNPLHGEDIMANKWFVVYRGITPGVYQSVLEALLNTSGASFHLYYPTLTSLRPYFMASSTTKSKNRLLTECQIAKQELTAHRQAQQLRNEKARLPMASKRAELKKRSPEEQQLYAEKARASQAKYREKCVSKNTTATYYNDEDYIDICVWFDLWHKADESVGPKTCGATGEKGGHPGTKDKEVEARGASSSKDSSEGANTI